MAQLYPDVEAQPPFESFPEDTVVGTESPWEPRHRHLEGESSSFFDREGLSVYGQNPFTTMALRIN
jgi:hypothetical protein